jgi:hypothetical protein
VEEERIKSALEIAMERISALPELTPEEIAEQKEKQYRPFGEAIAARYLSGTIREEEIAGEVNRYTAEQKQVVTRALILGLCSAVPLEGDLESAAKALKGIGWIVPEKKPQVEKAAESYQLIRQEFDREKQARAAEFGSSSEKRMQKLGISGSAVRLNLNENKEWQREMKSIRQKYDSKLNALRAGLLQLLV